MSYKFAPALLALPMIVTLAGCAGNDALVKRIDALESQVSSMEKKVNTAMQNSAVAKVDAATALHMLTSE